MIRTMLLFFLCACTLYSQTLEMKVWTRDGSTTSIPVQDIRKLTFSGGTYIGNGKLTTTIRTFTLLQNYPNPFNPSTTIQYQLPVRGDIKIKIFDINGRLIRVLENSSKEEGLHKIVWDGKTDGGHTVASGLYFYQVIFNKSMLSRKMLFIK